MKRLWQRLTGRKPRPKARRIVLHVGLPKCGSSAIQFWADRNRDWLRARGVDYPPCNTLLYPKHQGLVVMLESGGRTYLDELIAGSQSETLMLSTEGLSNHLYDFSDAALAQFRAAASGLPVDLVFVQRNPVDWAKSKYKQAILNPNDPARDNGQAFTLDEYLALPKVIRMMDFDTLFSDCVRAYAARDALRIELKSGWLEPLSALLGVRPDDGAVAPTSENVSVSDDVIELVRQMNGQRLDDRLRNDALCLVQLSEKTLHRTLEARLEWVRGQPADRAGLARVLDRLEPQSPSQVQLLQRLGGTLDALGPTW